MLSIIYTKICNYIKNALETETEIVTINELQINIPKQREEIMLLKSQQYSFTNFKYRRKKPDL